MDGRSKGKQNERHDADRFANQQTLRNRMFRNIAQDVPREWQKGRKGQKGGKGRKAWGAESGVHGWTFKEKQELRHGAAILANHLIKQVRMTSECAQDVHSLHVTSVESQNPFLGTLAPMAPAAVPFPTISSGTRNIAGTG